MRRIVILFFVTATIFSCGSQNKYKLVKGSKAEAPDANLKINDSIYIDYLEVSFIAYSEYQYYLDKIYGIDSKESQTAALDSNIINQLSEYAQFNLADKGEEVDVANLPVVGVSYEQAQAYAEWRTSAVLENSLIKAKLLYPYEEQDADSHFTPESYFSGEFTGYKPRTGVDFLVFRLPTEEEWEEIYNMSPDTSRSLLTITATFEDPKQEIQYINDNISEMTASPGVAMGGNWLDGKKRHIYEGTEVWLGFRCVADLMSSAEYMELYNARKKKRRRR